MCMDIIYASLHFVVLVNQMRRHGLGADARIWVCKPLATHFARNTRGLAYRQRILLARVSSAYIARVSSAISSLHKKTCLFLVRNIAGVHKRLYLHVYSMSLRIILVLVLPKFA